jgi:hypothetical protein
VLRQAFPRPESDRVHDAYFVFSILRALDRVDAMKSKTPILGEPAPLDYERARSARVARTLSSVEDVTAELTSHFEGLPVFGHPRAQAS